MTVPSDVRWTLASASPRRLALLRQVGIEPEVCPAHVEEIHSGDTPEKLGLLNSERKLRAVADDIDTGLILAADTLVLLDGSILGKPVDEGDALEMLHRLSGRAHEVMTAFMLMDAQSRKAVQGTEVTRVWMDRVPEDRLRKYVRSGHPMDKAGAYGIQGAAAAFVERLDGCYFNVVGLPISRVLREAAVLLDSRTPSASGGEDAFDG